jgi:hypothetical protein
MTESKFTPGPLAEFAAKKRMERAAPELVKALEAYDKAATALTDEQLINNPPLMSAVIDGRAALIAARVKP